MQNRGSFPPTVTDTTDKETSLCPPVRSSFRWSLAHTVRTAIYADMRVVFGDAFKVKVMTPCPRNCWWHTSVHARFYRVAQNREPSTVELSTSRVNPHWICNLPMRLHFECQSSTMTLAIVMKQWRRLHRARGHVPPPPLLQMAGHGGHHE